MSKSSKPTSKTPAAISAITVEGFKSIAEAQTLEVRPLTILAGANSSGKSSMMQPLLLLKQTLEAQYDPGPLLLNGPNVKFTSASQFLSSAIPENAPRRFSVGLKASDGSAIKIGFGVDEETHRLELAYNEYILDGKPLVITPSTISHEILEYARRDPLYNSVIDIFNLIDKPARFLLFDDRFFLHFYLTRPPATDRDPDDAPDPEVDFRFPFPPPPAKIQGFIQETIHVPGLRGTPERLYPITAPGPIYPGTFEKYVASIIASWSSSQSPQLQDLNEDLHALGLTWKIEARPISDVQVELRVGRLKKKPRAGGDVDLVSIADVGFGVSQTLPVLVALRTAKPGQLVYIEQPEIHLHPRAQVAMAEVLAKAALRGVRVVVETHSSLLLLGVQTLVAEGCLPPEHAGLNWFLRDENTGTTRIHTAELDKAGRFGDWPEDFDDTALDAESRYLSAAEAQLIGNGKDG